MSAAFGECVRFGSEHKPALLKPTEPSTRWLQHIAGVWELHARSSRVNSVRIVEGCTRHRNALILAELPLAVHASAATAWRLRFLCHHNRHVTTNSLWSHQWTTCMVVT